MNGSFALKLALSAALASTSQAGFAAEDYRQLEPAHHVRGAFIGLQANVAAGRSRPTARAALAAGSARRTVGRGHSGDVQFGSAIELRLDGTPRLSLGGQDVANVQRRLGIAPAAIVILGSLAAAATVVAVAASGGSETPAKKPPSPCPPGVEVCTQ